jgi:hypothetical protein
MTVVSRKECRKPVGISVRFPVYPVKIRKAIMKVSTGRRISIRFTIIFLDNAAETVRLYQDLFPYLWYKTIIGEFLTIMADLL